MRELLKQMTQHYRLLNFGCVSKLCAQKSCVDSPFSHSSFLSLWPFLGGSEITCFKTILTSSNIIGGKISQMIGDFGGIPQSPMFLGETITISLPKPSRNLSSCIFLYICLHLQDDPKVGKHTIRTWRLSEKIFKHIH